MKRGLTWRDVLGWTLLLTITAVAAWLRFTELDLKPMHHDEGVNAWFTKRLVEEFHYKYNPFYYHGPLLYFLTAPFLILKGYTAEAMRTAPALFGTLVVPAFYLVKDRIGWLGVLACAAVMALAPVEVYFSRTAIHEIYNGVFNVTLAGGFFIYWRRNQRWGLYLAAASLALLFATKETTAITVLAIAPALIAVAWFSLPRLTLPGGERLSHEVMSLGPSWWSRQADAAEEEEPWPTSRAPLSVRLAADRVSEAMQNLRAAARAAREAHEAAIAQAGAGLQPSPPALPRSVAHLAKGGRDTVKIPFVSFVWAFIRTLWHRDPTVVKVSVIVFIAVWALLFSSFLSNPVGIGSFFAAFFGWGRTGVEGKGHEKVWHYFMVKLLWPYYKPLLFVGLPGLIWGTLRRDAFSIFNLIWGILALAAYSVIPYKTPWCSISFVTPLFFGVGIGVAYIVEGAKWLAAKMNAPMLRPVLVGIPLLLSIWPMWLYGQESYKIQFEEYDVDGHYFIYVQNVREFMDLVDDLDGLLTVAEGSGLDVDIFLIRAKNPLRWYVVGHDADFEWTREYKENREKDMQSADILIAQRSHAKKLKDILDLDQYVQRWYHERPGQKFDVFIRTSLWERYLVAAERGEVKPPHEESPKRSFSDDRSKEMRDARKGKVAKKTAAPKKKLEKKKKLEEKKKPEGKK